MIASAPACSADFASATVVAVANHKIPRALSWETKAGEYNPMIEEMTLGATLTMT